jgi:hypothetical protein
MNWRLAIAILSAAAVVAAAGPARAAEGPCAPMAVAADARVRARWPDLAERIRAALEARPGVDTCARVSLTMPARAIALEVVLPDGRSASRAVTRAEDVVATLQALLLVPRETGYGRTPADDQTPAAEPEQAAQQPLPPPRAPAGAGKPEIAAARAGVAASNRLPPAPLPAAAPGGLGVELSVLAGARVGDGQTGGGLGVLTFLDARGWLVGFAGRADVYQEREGSPLGGALVLALLGGRRLRSSGTLALDLTAGPALALLGTMTSVTQVPPAAAPVRESRSLGTSPRLLAGARLHFRARSVLRTFVGVDAELGARRAPPDPPDEVGRLPLWAVGLLLGATVGTP